MTDCVDVKGHCLCGAVTLHAKQAEPHVHACHCATCRKWSGGPLLAVDCGENVQMEGGDHVVRYTSSDWADRGFCATCGTHLFYHFKPADMYVVPVGLFGDALAPDFVNQIFVDEQPSYYAFANDTTHYTGDEFVAKMKADLAQKA